jgi:hypothetical protein
VLGVVTGVSLLGVWQGTTPLVLVAAFALMVAAFDAVEPIGQEVDHPMRLGLLPVAPGDVIRRHLVAPVVLMAGVSLIAVATVITAGASRGLVGVVVVMVLPTALLALCCAALSVTNDPFKYVLTPQIGYFQSGFPVVLVIIGVSGPVLLARAAARHGATAAGVAVGCEFVVLLICAAVIAWLGNRISAAVPVRS